MSQVSDALTALFNKLETDELAIVLPLGDTYLQSIISNPSPENVVAQSLALEASVMAALPNMEAAAAKDAAAALKALLDLEAASLAAPATNVTAPVETPPTAA